MKNVRAFGIYRRLNQCVTYFVYNSNYNFIKKLHRFLIRDIVLYYFIKNI